MPKLLPKTVARKVVPFGHFDPNAANREAERLRHEAYDVYLDGRTAQARKYNRLADYLNSAADRGYLY